MSNAHRFSSPNFLDEQNRLRIPPGLRKQLKWETECTLTVFANLKHKFIELVRQENGPLIIDPYGRVQITVDLCDAMGWDPADQIYVKLNKQANGVTLSMYEKYDPSCVFCGSDDIATRVNLLDICKYHISQFTEMDCQLLVNTIKKISNPQFPGAKIMTLAPGGRILIFSDIYNKLGLSPGGRLTARMHPNNYIELTAKEDGELVIGGLDLVRLPKEMITQLGWEEYDKLAVAFDENNNLISITLADKYKPECVFCGSDDIAVTLQGVDICRHHVSELKKSRQ